jgi:hypothetical protein
MNYALRKVPNTMLAEVVLENGLVIGEVEFKNYGVDEGWRWRDFKGDWGDATDQATAVEQVLDRYLATRAPAPT